jgi:hypothetical protein
VPKKGGELLVGHWDAHLPTGPRQR